MLTTKVVSNKKPPLLSDSESGGSTSPSITYLCDEVVFLKDGKITESLKVKDLNKTTDEYAKKLIHSIIEF